MAARKVIAADRGAQYCLDAGVTPDLVVGDMDSLPADVLERLRQEGISLKVHPAMKDDTDTALALEEAVRLGADEVELLAATGDRFDHSLANVHLLYSALRRKVNACIVSPMWRIFLVDGTASIRGRKGATASLLPLTVEVSGISLTGFQWPLDDAAMHLGNPYGVSNVVTDDTASITVREGVLIAIVSEPGCEPRDKG